MAALSCVVKGAEGGVVSNSAFHSTHTDHPPLSLSLSLYPCTRRWVPVRGVSRMAQLRGKRRGRLEVDPIQVEVVDYFKVPKGALPLE